MVIKKLKRLDRKILLKKITIIFYRYNIINIIENEVKLFSYLAFIFLIREMTIHISKMKYIK